MKDRRSLKWVKANPLAASVKQWAEEYGQDPDWMTALFTVESHWDKNATDGLDSWGISQVQVSTAQLVADELGLKLQITASLLTENPDLAIRLGTKHYADLMEEFKGNPIQATRAYNRGHVGVKDTRLPGLDYFQNVFKQYWDFERFKEEVK